MLPASRARYGRALRRPLAYLLLLCLPKPSSRPSRLGQPDPLGEWIAQALTA